MKAILSLALLMGLYLQEKKNDLSTADKISGVYVFIHSKPNTDYEVVKSGKVVVLVDCNEIINKSIKNAAKEKGDGVIVYLETARYDVIKFK